MPIPDSYLYLILSSPHKPLITLRGFSRAMFGSPNNWYSSSLYLILYSPLT
uniref:Uncharacterized protein n=1 Tax=Megaselia scalaris TaxID=36166 RepID=T1GQM4_MEGSC